MKKVIGLFIVIFLSLILISCGEKKINKTNNTNQKHTVTLEKMIGEVCSCFNMEIEDLGSEYDSVIDDIGNETKRTYETAFSNFSFEYGKEKNSLNITLDDLVCKCEFDQRGFLLSITATNSNKKTKEMEFTYNDSGILEKSVLHEKESEIVTLFNESGKPYEEIEYDSQGEMVTKTEIDNNGIKTKTIFQDDEYKVEEYDIDGNCIRCSIFSKNGVIQSWYTYEYNEQGKEIKCSEYGADGSLVEWTEYKYEGDSLDKSTTYNAEGKIIDSHFYPTEVFDKIESGLTNLFSPLDDLTGAENFFFMISLLFGE